MFGKNELKVDSFRVFSISENHRAVKPNRGKINANYKDTMELKSFGRGDDHYNETVAFRLPYSKCCHKNN